MAASVRETCAVYKSLLSTIHCKRGNSQVSYSNQISNHKHSTFLRHKVILTLPSATV